MTWTKRMDFALWPVGQGLFTQMDIWVGGKSHRVVYDCGTFCTHEQVGASAFSPTANREIDLLVVSHFHWDHISRIPQLMNISGGVRDVWIPYLSPEQRLVSAFSAAIGGLASQGNDPNLTEVTSLASGGRVWFESRGCVVHEIGGPPREENFPSEEDIPLEDFPEEHRQEPLREPGIEDHDSAPPSQLQLRPPRPFPTALRNSSSFEAFQSQLDASRSSGYAESVVRLVTWVRPMSASLTRNLVKDMQKWIQSLDSSLNSMNLVDTTTGTIDTAALLSIVQAVSQKASRTEIKNIYEKLNPDLNATSLFLLAQPTIPRTEYRFSMSLKHHDYFELEKLHPGPAILWTGDAPAAVLEELLSDAQDPLKESLSAVLVHQVPHHGSASSISLRWQEAIGNRWNRHNCPMSVISAGRSNRFGHPSPEIVWRSYSKVICEGSPPLETSWAWR